MFPTEGTNVDRNVCYQTMLTEMITIERTVLADMFVIKEMLKNVIAPERTSIE